MPTIDEVRTNAAMQSIPKYLERLCLAVERVATALEDAELGDRIDNHAGAVAQATLTVIELSGCTGYLNNDGHIAHDGDTCPVHEGAGERSREGRA